MVYHLTLTSVVFEYAIDGLDILFLFNLTLTSVVFELRISMDKIYRQ